MSLLPGYVAYGKVEPHKSYSRFISVFIQNAAPAANDDDDDEVPVPHMHLRAHPNP